MLWICGSDNHELKAVGTRTGLSFWGQLDMSVAYIHQRYLHDLGRSKVTNTCTGAGPLALAIMQPSLGVVGMPSLGPLLHIRNPLG